MDSSSPQPSRVVPTNSIEIEITDLARGGAGVGRTAEGQVVFVHKTAPGDRVRAEVLPTPKKSRYVEARLLQILQPSALRRQPRCPVFDRCGGCDWQHLDESYQWRRKVDGALYALSRRGVNLEVLQGVPRDELPASNAWNYRNRIQVRGERKAPEHGGGWRIGMFERGSRRLVEVESCAIARPELNQALQHWRASGPPQWASDAGAFKLELEVAVDGQVQASWNQRHAAQGFRQVNDAQNSVLQQWVRDALLDGAHLRQPRVLWDLYGGSGNLSLPVADAFTDIRCVDVGARTPGDQPVPGYWQAIPRAVEFWIRGALRETWPAQRAAVLDPPREGLGQFAKRILESLKAWGPQTVVLVSCDVDAWCRDFEGLLQQGYVPQRLGFLDLFPQTHHVECLTVWKRL